MLEPRQITLIEKRRDAIRQWLDDEAPYVTCDQRHLDAHTPEQAYWQYGYQAALADMLRLLLQSTSETTRSSEDNSNPSRPAVPDAHGSPED
jgi:hypothetical protein